MKIKAIALLSAAVIVALVASFPLAADERPATKRGQPFRGRTNTPSSQSKGNTSGLIVPKEPHSRKSELPAAVRRARVEPPLDVAPIDRERRPAVDAAAAAIDGLIERTTARRPDDEDLDDVHFVRRAYLSLGGRIPTVTEVGAFLASKDAARRSTLIDSLLESPDWVSHFYNTWASTLRLSEGTGNGWFFFEPYLAWIKQSIADNRPYDDWVRNMLTADGKTWQNPAVGFQLRDADMPLPYVDNTVRVFLGTQIGCAQCHDHPFEDWTQRQFYELAAFTSGTRVSQRDRRLLPDGRREPLHPYMVNLELVMKGFRSPEKYGKLPGDESKNLRWLELSNLRRIDFLDETISLPDDDGAPGEIVEPRVPWGEVPEEARSLDSRAQLASWMTSHDNRQFARTIANRLWRFCFGIGVVEPIDDFRDGNAPSNPELLEHLTDLMLAVDFDQREFVRTIVSTKAWQRRAVAYDATSGVAHDFRAPILRRMSAEQAWDSLLAITCRDIWAYQREAGEASDSLRAFDNAIMNADLESAHAALQDFSRRDTREKLHQRLKKDLTFRHEALARASELPLPLRPERFLRVFGQGDREMIDGERRVATMPQVLSLWNSHAVAMVIDDGSLLMETIAANDSRLTLDIIFLAILARAPTASDRALIDHHVAQSQKPLNGVNDVIWALLNTREFLFVQ